ncbi:hypothetical protein F383_37116 [Gossypium arboreum]|uniref:Uncharacterized protein n=1 Tax=Gossypium arboreum TaxID=29729 RepID=A0A0B0MEK2_GOSAR|nr:hypothetical protein F383_37116 [Gossypium arboreum]
MLRSSLII